MLSIKEMCNIINKNIIKYFFYLGKFRKIGSKRSYSLRIPKTKNNPLIIRSLLFFWSFLNEV